VYQALRGSRPGAQNICNTSFRQSCVRLGRCWARCPGCPPSRTSRRPPRAWSSHYRGNPQDGLFPLVR